MEPGVDFCGTCGSDDKGVRSVVHSRDVPPYECESDWHDDEKEPGHQIGCICMDCVERLYGPTEYHEP